ncbi:fusaric acid resistance-like protein [Gregarina niphandrodes]|uniref:Fusaric acid resistance-like protein n=1 Tax=Gregarina niphandrodes TaxID=110365 RepID=A0A023BA39_GRENI|nr:fusaric acid resistance-like protein [Gregarina niphandrodes]EZG77685.1 fusaric acid resistance-like protein [Gregarina niphandrodes]|eukprot:XP_011129484.1 fusaric acid resistance-like protein [Gregarina niphandrodes]
MGEYDRADVCLPSWPLHNRLYNGALGRAIRCTFPMPFLIWFAYANPRDLAEPYLCPIIFALFVALYPPFVSSLVFGWFVNTPLVLGLLGYVTGMMRVVIHMADHGYSKTQTGLFAVGTYAALALFLSQGRVSANARLVYAAVISLNYPYDNVLLPLYHTLVRGIAISADGNMIAFIRSLLAGLETLPLPDLIKGLIAQVVHPDCDKLFTTVEMNGDTQATFVPNQQCEIPVLHLLDDMGGLFAGSSVTHFRVSTDDQYVNFKYRPQFGFLHQLWTAQGGLGLFRGLLLGSSLAMAVLTAMYLMNPASRSRYAAKQGLIRVQRKLYTHKTHLCERAKLLSRTDIVRERVDLVAFPPTRVSKLAAGSEPSWDVDQLHQRVLDLDTFVQSALLETAFTQAPGIMSYSHIKALQSCLAEEATQVALLARYWSNLTGPNAAPGSGATTRASAGAGNVSATANGATANGATANGANYNNAYSTWYHDVGTQIVGVHNGRMFDVTSALDPITLGWMREAFWAHMSLNKAVERLLTLDEIMGRNKVIAEIVAEVRHQLQLDLQHLVALDRAFVSSSLSRTTSFEYQTLLEQYRKTVVFHSIAKAKVGITFCEGELKRSYRAFLIGLLVPTLGGLLLVPVALCQQWVSTLVSIFIFKRRPLKYPESLLPGTSACREAPHQVEVHLGDAPCMADLGMVTGLVSQEQKFTRSEDSVTAAADSAAAAEVCRAGGYVWRSRERVIPLWQNAEAWGGLRHFLGQMVILSVYIFDWDLAKWWWLESGRAHKTQKSTLGDSLALPDIPSLFPHTNNGAGQEDNIKIIDYLVWMDVPTVKYSKQSGWTMLGFYCSLLISYQGTLKRGCLRFTAMLVGTFSAWCALKAFPHSIWGVGVWACVHMFVPTLLFSNPLDPRLGYDPHWGYAGQILTYHFLVVCFGVFFDPMQSRDELVVERIMGHVWGTLVAFILSLLLFPTSVNAQQRIRLSNSTVGIRRSLRALTELYAAPTSQDARFLPPQTTHTATTTVNAATETEDHQSGDDQSRDDQQSGADQQSGDDQSETYKAWEKVFREQINLFDFEMTHWNKMIEDGNMCDNLPILQNDRILKKIASALRQVGLLRTAGHRHLAYLVNTQSQLWEKDKTFVKWTKGLIDHRDAVSTDGEMDEDRLLDPAAEPTGIRETTGVHGLPAPDSSSELDISDLGDEPSFTIPRPDHHAGHRHDEDDDEDEDKDHAGRFSHRQVDAHRVMSQRAEQAAGEWSEPRSDLSSSSVWLEDVRPAPSPAASRSPMRQTIVPCHSPKRYMSTLSDREIMVVKKVIPVPVPNTCPHCRQSVPNGRLEEEALLVGGGSMQALAAVPPRTLEGATIEQRIPESVTVQEHTTMTSEGPDCSSLLGLVDLFEKIWIGVEVGILNIKTIDVADWRRELNRRLDAIDSATATHFCSHKCSKIRTERLHTLFRMWAAEVVIIKRIASYIEEFQRRKIKKS